MVVASPAPAPAPPSAGARAGGSSVGFAIGQMFASAVMFGWMAYLTKHATGRFSGGEIAFVRFGVGAAVGLAQARVRRVPLRPVRKDLLFLRGLFGGFAVLLYFVAISKLPVGTATLLNYSSPIFTTVFAALFLGEWLAPVVAFALLAAAAGVVLVVLGQGRALGGAYVWQLVGVGSAICSGAAITTIRAARRTDGPWEIFTAFCVIGMLATGPFAVAGWHAPSATGWGELALIGVIAVAAQMLMTDALGAVSASSSSILAQITVLVTMALGHFLDGDPVTLVTALGAALTLGGVTVAATITARMPKLPAVPAAR